MPPRSVQWKLDEHSLGKHLVLEKYIGAWLAILGQTEPRILIIDGFAGPGTYVDGEIGSPLIALKALQEHKALERINEVVLAFIEEDARRHAALEEAIKSRYPGIQDSKKVRVMLHQDTFADVIETVKASLADKQAQMAPAFVMLDPFGVKGVRFADIQWIFSQPKTETYLSFMGSWVNRFYASHEFEPHLDELFGDDGWREFSDIPDFGARQLAFLSYMDGRLRAAGAQHVVRFDLYSGNAYKYSIYFAGKHQKGCDRMKQAIWSAMPTGSYTYVGDSGKQLQIGFNDLPPEALDKELLDLLPTTGWAKLQQLKDYVESDRSRFHSSHLKSALKRLEVAGLLDVDETSRNRARTFPDGTRLRKKP